MNFNLLFVIILGSFTTLGVGYFCIDLYRNRHALSSGFDEMSDLDSADISEGYWYGFVLEILAGILQMLAKTLSHH